MFSWYHLRWSIQFSFKLVQLHQNPNLLWQVVFHLQCNLFFQRHSNHMGQNQWNQCYHTASQFKNKKLDFFFFLKNEHEKCLFIRVTFSTKVSSKVRVRDHNVVCCVNSTSLLSVFIPLWQFDIIAYES